MKKQKKAIPLVAKVIGSAVFLFVFIFNIMMFVQKNSNTSNLSLESLKAYAQTGGENGEGGEGGGENSTCPEGLSKGDYSSVQLGEPYQWWNPSEGKYYTCYNYEKTFICNEDGSACDDCDRVDQNYNCTPTSPSI
ncbi:hypothetical protein Pedsa_0284 [Pseudopedobacter saltans DSM 12145]|uniref:Uncharacterized protein n=1 Tax=Pseudopedobacter saltans (strain ATCC 51119 / DSM 12145 / JCM 21818 / CCUG 39354 / LMG 10337 / NBRC 100064 / NCIMB 13643) TaxID=762903 RepID=F0S4B2_PSESL|nr:hypothetical protein [Pseudopedobacter saltans]ADY50869.1 hypothetical protein Pedsa_0284 [Pseudopedobacter saltans DSM 12145]